MVRHSQPKTPRTSRDVNASLLDWCDNEIYSDDNGALLGQLSMLRAGMFVQKIDNPQWHQAVSRAVSH